MATKVTFFVIGCFLCLTTLAQPTKKTEEEIAAFERSRYLSIEEVETFKKILEQGPVITKYCNECGNLEAYFNALYNFDQDMHQYAVALTKSMYRSHALWKTYLTETVKNEDVKEELIFWHSVSEALSNGAAALLDLTTIWDMWQNGYGDSATIIQQFDQTLTFLDGILAKLNTLQRIGERDASKTVLGDWNNTYTTMRSSLAIVYDGWRYLKKLDYNIPLTNTERIQVRRKRAANVAAAIAQLANIYAGYQNNLMKERIKHLDKVLSSNQKVQTVHYDNFIKKSILLDKLQEVKLVANKRTANFTALKLSCNNVLNIQREKREKIEIKDTLFGKALRYYKNQLPKSSQKLLVANTLIKDCDFPLKPYEVIVLDGEGNKIVDEEITVTDNYFDTQYKVKSHNDQVTLPVGIYDFQLLGQTTYDIGFRMPHTINDHQITGYEKEVQRHFGRVVELKFSPYGRLEIEVVDDKQIGVPFKYVITKDIDQPSIKYGNQFYKYALDLSANRAYQVTIMVGSDEKTFKNIKIYPTKKTTIKIVHSRDARTISEKIVEPKGQEFKPEENKGVIKPVVADSKDAPNYKAPAGWVVGTVYNSNDGSCNNYQDKYLEFSVERQKIIDLRTGKYVDGIVVAPGESLKIAAPELDGHFRGYLIDPIKNLRQRISFWYYDNLFENWWFAVGCDDGTKPMENCSDGSNNYNQREKRICYTINGG